MKTDLILLHPPSIYDFREHSIMFGPVSDLVPSTPIFEMYPIGFPILAHYLEKHGYRVRIINLAIRMLKNPFFDVEKFISNLETKCFGIDLHWLPHAHGSIEIAKIVKKYHPETPVIFGGYSSTYFHEELIKYSPVDFIIKGDSAEEPLRMLVEAIVKGGNYHSIPNLTWKDKDGTVNSNNIDYVPSDLSHISLDYSFMMRSVFKYKDLLSYVPFVNWLDYPIVAALSCRGCYGNCVTCGGSSFTFKELFNRPKPACRSPEMLAFDILKVQEYIKGPIFILGDILQHGVDYAGEMLEILKKNNLKNKLTFELFKPPPYSFLKKLVDLKVEWSMEISVESHEEKLRKIFGKKSYSNHELKDFIKSALELGCERFDLYFMTGIPFQTKDSILKTGEFCEEIYKEIDKKQKLLTFISPMAPFLDPGSRAYENPEKYGYKLSCNSLEDHRKALLKPSWKYIMNYESDYLSRDEMVDGTYRAALGLNEIKAKYGVVDKKTAKKVENRVLKAMEIMRRIDDVVKSESFTSEEERHVSLRREMTKYNMSTVCEKKELEWKTSLFFKFRLHKIITMMLRGE